MGSCLEGFRAEPLRLCTSAGITNAPVPMFSATALTILSMVSGFRVSAEWEVVLIAAGGEHLLLDKIQFCRPWRFPSKLAARPVSIAICRGERPDQGRAG